MPIQNATKKSAHDALPPCGSAVFPGGAGCRLPPCRVTVLSCHRSATADPEGTPVAVPMGSPGCLRRTADSRQKLAVLQSSVPELRNQFERRGHGPDGFSQLPDTVFV